MELDSSKQHTSVDTSTDDVAAGSASSSEVEKTSTLLNIDISNASDAQKHLSNNDSADAHTQGQSRSYDANKSTADAPVYKENDVVYCYSVGALYKAKILDIKPDEETNETIYQVHYFGWHSKWDEWVGIESILPDNEETLAKKKQIEDELEKRKNDKKKKKRQSRDGESESSGNQIKKKKSKKDGDTSQSDTFSESAESQKFDIPESAQIPIPQALKKRLMQDFENITQKNMLVSLPHKYPVANILDDFLTHKSWQGNDAQLMKEVVAGVLSYFNKTLETMLIYRFERLQAETLISRSKKLPCEIFGIEHFLRCFVKLPVFLAESDIDDASRKLISSRIQEIVRFVAKRENLCFCNEEKASGYVRASPEYIQRLKSSSSATESNKNSQISEAKTPEEDGVPEFKTD